MRTRRPGPSDADTGIAHAMAADAAPRTDTIDTSGTVDKALEQALAALGAAVDGASR
ncbi:hypothetical protein [Actinomadura fibrosa]|uniref:Uncharacterized protein n=1 Tax=Actinomadura fibrosa TaxID=111802 RepID=A0ABW2XQL2_9ACTN|nr:hypothetical protein [Actinomadura fibrosa]